MAVTLNTLNPTGVPTVIARYDWKQNLNFMRYLLAQPLKAFQNITMIGPDDTVAQNNFGTTVALSVGNTRRTGEVIGLEFSTIASLAASGTIILEAFNVELFKADPALTVNKTGIGPNTVQHRVNRIAVAATDWDTRTATEGIGHKNTAVPFETSLGGTLWTSVRHKGSTSFNSVATANERLAVSFYMRLDY